MATVPKEVIVDVLPVDLSLIQTWLSDLKGQRVRIVRAQRGPRAEYMRLVRQNAEQNLKAFLAHQELQETISARSLTELAAALDLPEPPHRIECYDVSNVQGTNPVASMVVFAGGRPRKSDYRRFRIRYDGGANDFAMMQETLRRRLRYLRADTNAPGESDAVSIESEDGAIERQLQRKDRFHRRPDLLLIDGGKGQLSAVAEVLEELDLWGIPVAGLAKEHEWLYVPGSPDPIVLPANSAGLHLVRRIRDEAHRFRRRVSSQAARPRDDRDGARRDRGNRTRPAETAVARLRLDLGAPTREPRRDSRRQRDEPVAGCCGEGRIGRICMNLIVRIIVNALALLLVAYILRAGVHIDSVWHALIVAVILGIVNAVLRPILFLITLPLQILTLGLFTLVINGFLLWWVAQWHLGLTFDGY